MRLKRSTAIAPQISLMRFQSCHFGCSFRYSLKSVLSLLPLRQIAFGHKGSRSDIAGRMDQPDEVLLLEGSVREYPCGPRRHRVVASSRQADHEQLRRLSPPVSNPNDSDDGATCVEL